MLTFLPDNEYYTMSSYLKFMLLPGEKVVASGGSHPAVYLPGLSLTLLALVFGYLKNFLGQHYDDGFTVVSLIGFHIAMKHVGMILYMLATVCFIYGVIRIALAFNEFACAEYVVTDRRIIVKEGIIKREIIEMDLEFLIKIVVVQTVMGKILNYGNIIVYDHSGDTIPMPTTANPYDLKKQVAANLPKHRHP